VISHTCSVSSGRSPRTALYASVHECCCKLVLYIQWLILCNKVIGFEQNYICAKKLQRASQFMSLHHIIPLVIREGITQKQMWYKTVHVWPLYNAGT
jgi:hypothetical protein